MVRFKGGLDRIEVRRPAGAVGRGPDGVPCLQVDLSRLVIELGAMAGAAGPA